jgi:hypothetical protein
MTDRPEAHLEVEAALLRAARSYTAPPEARQHTMAALGLGGAGAVSVAPGAGKAAGWALAWKIGGLLVIAGAIGGIVAAGMHHGPPPLIEARVVAAQAPVATVGTADAPLVIASPTAPVVMVPETPARPPHVASTTPTPAPAASSLAEEIKMLDRVSASLSAHDGAGALTELDAYQARFPRGSMTLEATVLRIEALRQSGNGAAADALADDFLAKHPTSVLAPRVMAGKKSGGQ